MSASEKLKALQQDDHFWMQEVQSDWLITLGDALPQIVAVIEAADALPDFFTTDDGRVHSFVPLLDELEKVLS